MPCRPGSRCYRCVKERDALQAKLAVLACIMCFKLLGTHTPPPIINSTRPPPPPRQRLPEWVS